MFAGIVEGTGRVVRTGSAEDASGAGAVRLEIDLGVCAPDAALGASIAVNGVCLTLATLRGTIGGFDVIPETLRRTNLGRLKPHDRVNLERSLRVGDRIDGHFVQGHVDGCGTVQRVERERGEYVLWTRVDPQLTPYIVPKGSIAIDGVSLTVVAVEGDCFSVALIPTTLERTVLGERRRADVVNIETDILARLVVHHLQAMTAGAGAPRPTLTLERLRETGFVS